MDGRSFVPASLISSPANLMSENNCLSGFSAVCLHLLLMSHDLVLVLSVLSVCVWCPYCCMEDLLIEEREQASRRSADRWW